MPKPLNRIEWEYVFTSFLKEKPFLSILHSGGFLKLSGKQYKIENSFIYFAEKNDTCTGTSKILFTHKKRPLYFSAVIKKKDGVCFFKFSDALYKYDITEDEESVGITFTNSGGGKLSATIADNIFLKAPHFAKYAYADEADKNAVLDFSSKIFSAMGVACKKPSFVFLKIMYEIAEKGLTPYKEPCLVFADGTFLLIFIKPQKLKRISAMLSAKTEIRFERRTINLAASFLFEYTAKATLACFEVTDIQEEDKRFLYENTYLTKYGI